MLFDDCIKSAFLLRRKARNGYKEAPILFFEDISVPDRIGCGAFVPGFAAENDIFADIDFRIAHHRSEAGAMDPGPGCMRALPSAALIRGALAADACSWMPARFHAAKVAPPVSVVFLPDRRIRQRAVMPAALVKGKHAVQIKQIRLGFASPV